MNRCVLTATALPEEALRQEEREQDHDAACPMRPPRLGPFQPRNRIERNPNRAHQRQIGRRRRDYSLHDQRDHGRYGETEDDDMKTTPAARPPRAGILQGGLNVSHDHQTRRRARRRFSCPTAAVGAAVP